MGFQDNKLADILFPRLVEGDAKRFAIHSAIWSAATSIAILGYHGHYVLCVFAAIVGAYIGLLIAAAKQSSNVTKLNVVGETSRKTSDSTTFESVGKRDFTISRVLIILLMAVTAALSIYFATIDHDVYYMAQAIGSVAILTYPLGGILARTFFGILDIALAIVCFALSLYFGVWFVLIGFLAAIIAWGLLFQRTSAVAQASRTEPV